jgi:hypothetical protein
VRRDQTGQACALLSSSGSPRMIRLRRDTDTLIQAAHEGQRHPWICLHHPSPRLLSLSSHQTSYDEPNSVKGFGVWDSSGDPSVRSCQRQLACVYRPAESGIHLQPMMASVNRPSDHLARPTTLRLDFDCATPHSPVRRGSGRRPVRPSGCRATRRMRATYDREGRGTKRLPPARSSRSHARRTTQRNDAHWPRRSKRRNEV